MYPNQSFPNFIEGEADGPTAASNDAIIENRTFDEIAIAENATRDFTGAWEKHS